MRISVDVVTFGRLVGDSSVFVGSVTRKQQRPRHSSKATLTTAHNTQKRQQIAVVPVCLRPCHAYLPLLRSAMLLSCVVYYRRPSREGRDGTEELIWQRIPSRRERGGGALGVAAFDQLTSRPAESSSAAAGYFAVDEFLPSSDRKIAPLSRQVVLTPAIQYSHLYCCCLRRSTINHRLLCYL